MKIRTDFVTNSSSSSFVIAYKNFPEIDQETIEKYPFLENYNEMIRAILFTEGYNETNVGELIKNKEDLDEYYKYRYVWGKNTLEQTLKEKEELAKRYHESLGYIEKGFHILDKNVDYADYYCQSLINNLAKDNDNFVILEDE